MSDKIAAAKEKLRRWRADLPAFAEDNLKIITKDPNLPLIPLRFNAAQLLLHEAIETQLRETGKVRMLVPKARQHGISTYVAARFYRRASMWRSTRVYILTHMAATTTNLFDMVDRYHVNNPIRPHTAVENARQLVFDRLSSSYVVATAGAKAGGHGFTITHFHGSEVALWENASDHFAGSVQAVSPAPGTEVILESTSAGPSGEFYERCQDAIRGVGEYRVCFLPWTLAPEYATPVPEGFELSEVEDAFGISEVEYAQMYGLSNEQMLWRRNKIAEIRDEYLFRKQYPISIEEAFSASNEGALIPATLVLRARKRQDVEGYGPLVIGVDPAGPGGDRFAVARRRGHKVEKVEWRNKIDPMEAITWLFDIIQREKPARMYIDAGGIGYAVIAGLKARGADPQVVQAVNFGGKSQAKTARPKMPGPVNRRAEMWVRSKEWLELEEGVSIPDMDVLQEDACGPKIKPTVTNDLLLESKDDMRKRKVRSPDLWDAVALTFADKAYIQSTAAAAPPVAAPSRTIQPRYYGGGGLSWQGV